MLKPTSSYPDHKAGLGLYMVRPATKPQNQPNAPRPSTGMVEMPIQPMGNIIPHPDWVEALRQEDTPIRPPMQVQWMSGPPCPFITPYLIAAHEGRTALDPPGDTALPLPLADPQPTDLNQFMPPWQLNGTNTVWR